MCNIYIEESFVMAITYQFLNVRLTADNQTQENLGHDGHDGSSLSLSKKRRWATCSHLKHAISQKEHLYGMSKNKRTKLGRKAVFPPDLKTQLLIHFIHVEKYFYELVDCDIRCRIFQVELKHLFPQEKQAAGKKWFRLFRKKHLCQKFYL